MHGSSGPGPLSAGRIGKLELTVRAFLLVRGRETRAQQEVRGRETQAQREAPGRETRAQPEQLAT